MQNRHTIELLPLAGYPVLSLSYDELCAMLQNRLRTPAKTVLVFANTNFVLQCRPLRQWLNREEVIIVNDGIGMDIASLMRHGRPYRHNLNGTDFLPHLLQTMAEPQRIFLLGGKPGVADKAAQVIALHSQHSIAGTCDGYSTLPPQQLCARINASQADIVLVAMGNPIQEEWIRQHMAELRARLFISVGALFDFLAGSVRRAPLWMQKLRLEWLFRLYQEPRRMVKRYTVDIARFLWLCVSYPLQQRV
ncbi:MAG: WecB/TagA/CpsF family glycosyltransferase [Rhodoferax sp.]|nr:WecB/TagA/CpsF family glycosyltransferase [Rhodoferax sp.]